MMMPFTLNFIFTVMDQYIVHSIPNFQFSPIFSDLVYKIGHETILPSYFIQVRKISYIIFSFVHNLISAYVVYDGPGFLSNLIVVKSPISKIISTSTFQCIIQILMYSALIHVDIFRYTSKYLNNYNNSIVVELTHHTPIPLQLPNTVCLGYICIIHINTKSDLQINVTFNKIVSEGIYNPTCKYGGIVAAEFLDNEYKESTTICQNHSGQIGQSRGLYSSNSSLVLVFYWYKMYQNFTTSITLSLTRCKPANIDLCEFNSLCS